MSKCIVCGCTDRRACPEGCGWVSLDPPVCTSCVRKWMLASTWRVVFELEKFAKGDLARDVEALRDMYHLLSRQRAEEFGIPTLRQVCQINRNANKWHEQNPTLARSRRRGSPTKTMKGARA